MSDDDAGVNPMVRADDIQWRLEPTPTVESVENLLALDGDELLFSARDAQVEIDTLRELLHETLAALTRANEQRERYVVRVRALIEQLRAARHDRDILSAQLRALHEAI